MKAIDVKKELKKHVNLEKKEFFPRFFKTGPGEYGEGDVFLGVTVPHQRKIAKQFKQLPLTEVKSLLDSKYHEERLTGLFILVLQFEKAAEKDQKTIANFYKKNISAVNNWDLVDSSAHKILGPYLIERDKKLLYTWSRSKDLWKRRIAIMTTFHFISKGHFEDTFQIAEKLLNDKEDLIHKAVGWMLREVGNKDLTSEEKFLKKHYKQMPRTMLRYAIEKFPEKKRKAYLNSKI